MKIIMTALIAANLPFVAMAADGPQRRKPNDKADSIAVYPKGWVGMYPFAVVGSSLMFGYQHRFSSTFGLQFNSALGLSENSNYYGVQGMAHFFAELQGRYFAFNYSEKNGFFLGLYAAPFLKYKRMSFEVNTFEFGTFNARKTSAAGFGGGALVGIQFGWKALVMDFYMGVGVQTANGDYLFIDNTVIDRYRRSTFFHPGLSVGVKLY
jgi:hypothetical protein